jgi:hypothetical protein
MNARIPFLFATLLALAVSAQARVYTLHPTQTFEYANPDGSFGPPKVAIDGNSAIALMDTATGREALLFQRSELGQWAFVRTLLSVPASPDVRNEVAMQFGIAAILLDDVLHIYERGSNGAWSESATAGTPRAAGVISISNYTVVVGRLGCDYGADVFEKSVGSGVWRIIGRVTGAPGECTDHGAELDYNQPIVLMRNPSNEVRVHQRTGAFDWPQIGSFAPPAGVSFGSGPPTLYGLTAIFDGGAVFRGDAFDYSRWNYRGTLRPLNWANGAGGGSNPNYRDSYALTHTAEGHPRDDAYVYVYYENGGSPAGMQHHAVLRTPGYAIQSDVSDRTVVASSQGFGGERFISFFALSNDATPLAYANDFHSPDREPLQQTPGSQFARVTANGGLDGFLRQSSLAGDAQAWVPGIDWRDQQAVEADITPTAVDGADRWVGLAVRYVDANNHYYVTLRSSNVIQLKRKVAGAFATLAQAPLPFSLNARRHVQLIVNGNRLAVNVDGTQRLTATDGSLTHGSVALLTYRARADFDNLHASPTVPFNLALKDMTDLNDTSRPFSQSGGSWTPIEGPDGEIVGRAQTSTAGDVRAITGTATDDQVVRTRARLDAYGASGAGAWFGLIARWRGSGTHYYMTIRSTNRLEIRKQVAGAITTLVSVPFTAQPGRFYDLAFSVRRDELHAYVDGVLVAQAADTQIPDGQFGLGMYRTAATFSRFEASQ